MFLVEFIPEGCTSFLQLLDVAINKVFKNNFNLKFNDWLRNDGLKESNTTTKGYYKCPNYNLI